VYPDNLSFSVWAANFLEKYPDVIKNWKEHGDPFKKGLALLVLKEAV
jgi:hypothetical protein